MVEGIMKQNDYIKILVWYANQSAKVLSGGQPLDFQQENNPKHTTKSVKKWLVGYVVYVLESPRESPNLDPIVNM